MITVLFAATFANAQISLLQSDVNLLVGSKIEMLRCTTEVYIIENSNWFVIGDYILDNKTSDTSQTLYIYDEDLNLIKSFSLAQLGVTELKQVAFISRNIFTNDGSWAWLRSNMGANKKEIVTESGTILATMDSEDSYLPIRNCVILKVGNKYLFGDPKGYYGSYDIYSLPGNGETEDVSEVTTPRHSARKYMQNEQVLIDSNDRTYNIQGQEVK